MYKMKPLTERGTPSKDRIAFRLSNEGLVTLTGSRKERHVYSVDLNRLSILHHIPTIDHQVDSSDALILGYLSYLYTLRLANTKMMRRLTTVHKDVVTQTKDNIFKSDDIVSYKIATLRCVAMGLTPDNYREIENHFRACGLTSDDAIFYHLLYHNSDIQDFLKLVNTIEDQDAFVLTVDSLSKELENHPKALTEFSKQSGYFAYRKLKFIADGNRFDPGDMQQDLKERGIQAYYWVRPFYGVEHAINYAKRSMHGHMNVLIDYWTHESRNRVVSEEGGYTNTVRSFKKNEDSFEAANMNHQEDAMLAYIDMKRTASGMYG